MDDLVRLAKAGDRSALEQLLVSIAPSIQRFGLRMCKSDQDSEDVLQDTLVTILRHLPEFEGRSSFTSWVFALTRSACTRRRRGLKNKPGVDLDDAGELSEAGPTPEQGADSREMSRILAQAMDQLPEEYREVILLRDVEALTAPEAAQILGISVDALKSRLHRARQSLRTALSPVLEPTTVPPAQGCPDVTELWSRKLEGDLDALDCAQMEKHLLTCPACASACSALKTALGACRRESARDVRPEVQEQVRSALRVWLKQLSPEELHG
ncbi:MAG TPA: sigma-70 family RNA polymerase sigma factor [Polyangiaceae bacterium]